MSKAEPIQIIGAGGHAKVVIQTARTAGFEPVVVWDDNTALYGQTVCGVRIKGSVAEADRNLSAVIAVGNNAVRKKISESLPLHYVTIIHPAATADETVKIGEGTVVFAGTVIQPDTVIGRHCIINTSASVDHDNRIGDFVHIAPGCLLCGGVSVGEGTLLGVGTCIKPGIQIGEWSILGAGAVAVSNIPNSVTAFGIPAKKHDFAQTPKLCVGGGEIKFPLCKITPFLRCSSIFSYYRQLCPSLLTLDSSANQTAKFLDIKQSNLHLFFTSNIGFLQEQKFIKDRTYDTSGIHL